MVSRFLLRADAADRSSHSQPKRAPRYTRMPSLAALPGYRLARRVRDCPKRAFRVTVIARFREIGHPLSP